MNALINSENKYSTKDVAEDILPDMQWESEHFGFCSIQCADHCQCSAVFHFDGNLRVFCINKYCVDIERQFNIPASMLGKVASEWNDDKKQAISVV